MTFKGHSRSSASSLDRLYFLSETGKVGDTYFQTKLLKWRRRWINVSCYGTVQ